MNFLKENWFRLSIVLIILGTGYSIAYYFLSYIPTRDTEKSIEAWTNEKLERSAKDDQDKRDYIAKRKKDCFDIYDKEKSNWNNTKGMEYNADSDICYVLYKSQGEWEDKDCSKFISDLDDSLPAGSTIRRLAINNWFDCTEKQFRKEF